MSFTQHFLNHAFSEIISQPLNSKCIEKWQEEVVSCMFFLCFKDEVYLNNKMMVLTLKNVSLSLGDICFP